MLAGEEAGPRWSRPLPLISVLRAAATQLEQYERVTLHDLPVVEVRRRAVDDIVRLVTELLDNATAFSPPDTEVSVSGTLRSDGGVTALVVTPAALVLPAQAEDWEQPGARREVPFDVDDVLVIAPAGVTATGTGTTPSSSTSGH